MLPYPLKPLILREYSQLTTHHGRHSHVYLITMSITDGDRRSLGPCIQSISPLYALLNSAQSPRVNRPGSLLANHDLLPLGDP